MLSEAISNLNSIRKQLTEAEKVVIDELKKTMSNIIKPDHVDQWLNTFIEAFNSTPLNLIKSGNLKALELMIYRLESGEGF